MLRTWWRVGMALCVGVGALGASATPALAGTNLIKNGSFERPILDSPDRVFASGKHLGAWTVGDVPFLGVDGSIDLVRSDYWQAQDGSQSVDLDGLEPGTISQTIATTPGVGYRVGFWLTQNPDCGPAVKDLLIELNGSGFASVVIRKQGTHDNMNWMHRVRVFEADSSSTTISFVSDDGSGSTCGVALDKISVKPFA
jgi:choice-of-anchor C domain-containing protein